MGKAKISGVAIRPEKRIENVNGDLFHAIKRSSPGFIGFGETYFSTILHGKVKGWKCHREVTLNIVVPVGRVRFVIYDDRADSPTYGHYQEVVLGPHKYSRLTVAPGLWMAFQGDGEGINLLCNTIDKEHDFGEADNCELNSFQFAWPY